MKFSHTLEDFTSGLKGSATLQRWVSQGTYAGWSNSYPLFSLRVLSNDSKAVTPRIYVLPFVLGAYPGVLRRWRTCQCMQPNVWLQIANSSPTSDPPFFMVSITAGLGRAREIVTQELAGRHPDATFRSRRSRAQSPSGPRSERSIVCLYFKRPLLTAWVVGIEC